MSSAMQIEERAAQWLLRRQGEQWGPAEQALLDAWLAESTANEVAYLRLEHGWRKVDRLASLHNPNAFPSTVRPSTYRMRNTLRWGIAATLLLAVAAIVWRQVVLAPGSYTTEIGGHETVPLADGSRIELNTDTRVRTEVSDKARTVWLDRGEAYFAVTRAPSTPFVVYAGTRRITVLGTQFSVRRDGDQVRVAVTEGRVRVDQLAPSDGRPPIIVTPGSAVRAEGSSNLLEPRSLDKMSRELSWRQGILVFDRTTLADAAEEFNRYNHRKLVVVDPAVAATRIGGSFEATNVEVFARLLRNGFGLTVAEEGEAINISH